MVGVPGGTTLFRIHLRLARPTREQFGWDSPYILETLALPRMLFPCPRLGTPLVLFPRHAALRFPSDPVTNSIDVETAILPRLARRSTGRINFAGTPLKSFSYRTCSCLEQFLP